MRYVRYNDCGTPDYKYEYVCGECGHVCNYSSTKTNNIRYCRQDCECGPSACAELRKYSASATSTTSQADADKKAQDAANKKAEDASKKMSCNPTNHIFLWNDGSTSKSVNIPCAGSSYQYNLKSYVCGDSTNKVDYTVSSKPSWATVSQGAYPGGGTDTHQITISATKNPSTTSRTGTITLTQSSSGKTLQVRAGRLTSTIQASFRIRSRCLLL